MSDLNVIKMENLITHDSEEIKKYYGFFIYVVPRTKEN